jgi:hypothetical protein
MRLPALICAFLLAPLSWMMKAGFPHSRLDRSDIPNVD